MSLPSKLKLMNLFVDGQGYHGEVTEVTLPKYTQKVETYRAGGMIGEVDIELGLEKLELEFKTGGLVRKLLGHFSQVKIDGLQMRFAGAYQKEDSGDVDDVEVVARGRLIELDQGSAKAGDDSEHSFKASLTYYKLIINGDDVIEVDMLNTIHKVDGVDKLEKHRNAIGI